VSQNSVYDELLLELEKCPVYTWISSLKSTIAHKMSIKMKDIAASVPPVLTAHLIPCLVSIPAPDSDFFEFPVPLVATANFSAPAVIVIAGLSSFRPVNASIFVTNAPPPGYAPPIKVTAISQSALSEFLTVQLILPVDVTLSVWSGP
jgi:hypothetical protein